jgi:hypothetical protein
MDDTRRKRNALFSKPALGAVIEKGANLTGSTRSFDEYKCDPRNWTQNSRRPAPEIEPAIRLFQQLPCQKLLRRPWNPFALNAWALIK